MAQYGVALPGDPIYGFPAAPRGGPPVLVDNLTKNLVAFAAKGNIVVGDYTSNQFATHALPLLQPRSINPNGKTQRYVIDPTDEDLGYFNDGYDSQNRPRFDGNYNQQDKEGGALAFKLDNVTPRKFYESTLKDTDFQALLRMPAIGGTLTIDGVLFTNHAMAGYAPGSVTINGAVVARDDGLYFNNANFRINHDIRLSSGQLAQQVVLPMSIQRPRLTNWVDCGTACP